MEHRFEYLEEVYGPDVPQYLYGNYLGLHMEIYELQIMTNYVNSL